jgi:plastocyanin
MVQLMDFKIALDRSTVSAGMVTFIIKNNGPSPHNFNVKIGSEEKGVPTLDPGATATLTLDLKPGTYDYRCNIPGHDLLGMKGTLTVK